MSVIADKVYNVLKDVFPYNIVVREHYVNYQGTKLFFDLFDKTFNVLFEIQGRQHTKFVKFFHGDKENFIRSKYRDNLKFEYTQEKNMPFVIFNYDEEITKELVLYKMYESLKENGNG